MTRTRETPINGEYHVNVSLLIRPHRILYGEHHQSMIERGDKHYATQTLAEAAAVRRWRRIRRDYPEARLIHRTFSEITEC